MNDRMKCLTVLGLIVLSGLALIVAVPDYGLAEEPVKRKYYIILEGRYTYARGDETTYTELIDYRNGNLITTYDVELEDGWSGKIGVGIRVNREWDLSLSYTGLDVEGDDSPGQDFAANYYYLWPVLGTNAYYYYTAEAKAEATYQVVDFEAGYSLRLGDADIRLSAGIRYAEFDQDVKTNFYFPGYTTAERREVNYWGIGPRIGVAATVPVGGSNFFLTGRMNGAVLFGDNESETTWYWSPPGASDKSSDGSSRKVYNFDGELGLGYRFNRNSNFSALVIAGYRAEAWYDINDTSSSGSVLGNRYGGRHSDQIFYGPFLRTEFFF